MKFFAAKEDPQPHADSDWGLLTIEKADRMSSSLKSTVAPFMSSKELTSILTSLPSRSNTLLDNKEYSVKIIRNILLHI